MQQRLTIITLGVKDVKASEDFYTKVFGWAKSDHSNDNITFLQLNGILLSLYNREALAEDVGIKSEGSGFKAFTLAHNTHSEKEVDKLFAMFESKNVKIIKPPQKVFWGGYSGYIADPDNNLWEIAYNPFLELDEKGNVQ
ncbi:MAG: VOC family protein [Bacteroidota bacterium]